MNNGSKTVLVTGGTGWIGSWAIIELLKRGFTVRTTVRSLSKESAVRKLISAYVDPGERLSFFAADLTKDAGWDAAVAGCDYVLHVASPTGADMPRDPNVLIIPARDGALRVLRAACRAKVQRVVMTSGCVACARPLKAPDGISDEKNWADTTDPKFGPYNLSKAIAERAAWDFMKNQSGPTTLTTILPSAVLGPVFSSEKISTAELVVQMMNGNMPGIPNMGFCTVDVRDVIDLHIRAMVAPEAAGERFIATGDWVWFSDVAKILRSNLGESAKKVPTRMLPDFVVRAIGLFNRPMRYMVPSLGKKHAYSSAKVQAALGWNPRPAATTIVDCAQSLIKTGAV